MVNSPRSPCTVFCERPLRRLGERLPAAAGRTDGSVAVGDVARLLLGSGVPAKPLRPK